MKLKEYVKDKKLLILMNILAFSFLGFLFYLYDIDTSFILLTIAILLLPMIVFFASDFFKRRKYYYELLEQLKDLDKKYLIQDIIKEPDFLEGRLLYNILQDTNRCMHENINIYKHLQQEYREYVETWVHEIKTPIFSGKLVIENDKNETTLSVLEELNKIEEFVEQALYYSRSNNTEDDYIVREFPLKTAINEVIRKNSTCFIQRKIKLDMGELNDTLFTDIKWVQFIINQIILNSINYSKAEKPVIKIYTMKNENNITLYIQDNGIGISEKDLPMVFNKGFTGQNGRKYKKSTGIGLYLCKKLCDKLGFGIYISSSISEGTTVSIVFPRSKMMLLE